MKKIKIFTNHFMPESFRINDFSFYLSDNFEVAIITQTPNYPEGKFKSGYGWFKKSKSRKYNLDIRRLPVIPRGNNSVMLFLNYVSYIFSSMVYALTTKERSNYVFAYITSPIFISWSALYYANKSDAKSIMYLLDLWPDSLISILNIKNKKVVEILNKTCLNIYNKFDTIIISSQSFKTKLIEMGVSSDKIYHIPQNADTIEDIPICLNSDRHILRIVFTGNIGEAQNLNVLINAANELKKQGFQKVMFTLVGNGRALDNLKNNIEVKEVQEYFEFRNRVPFSELKKIYETSHMGFISLKNDPTFNCTLPAKLQTYMGFGIPILACANGEIPNTIYSAKCGYCVAADDYKNLASIIIHIYKNEMNELESLGKNGWKFAKENYDSDKIFKKMEDLIID